MDDEQIEHVARMTDSTDKEILALARASRDGTATDAIIRNSCIVALGLTLHEQDEVAAVRETLTGLITMRKLR